MSVQRKEFHIQCLDVMMNTSTLEGSLKPLVENASFKMITLLLYKDFEANVVG